MNLDALTQIPLADLGMGVVALVLVIGVSLYARKHGVSLRADSPAHKCLDDYCHNPAHSYLRCNVYHNYPEDD